MVDTRFIDKTESFIPPYLSRHVSTIITMATPHTSLPIAVDASVHKFYDIVNTYWKRQTVAALSSLQNSTIGADNSSDRGSSLNHVTVISISGGYRDEMIHPKLCNLDHIVHHSISVRKDDSFMYSAVLYCALFDSL